MRYSAPPISSELWVPTNTTVYNLEVSDTHTYIANGFAVHNKGGGGHSSGGMHFSSSGSHLSIGGSSNTTTPWWMGIILVLFIAWVIFTFSRQVTTQLNTDVIEARSFFKWQI